MYHYANRPGLSTQRSRQVLAKSFTTLVDGLPGNDGALFTWPNPIYQWQLNPSFQTLVCDVLSLFHKSVALLRDASFAGAMGSYVAFYLAGLYPVPATRQFLLSSPYFPQISFKNPAFNKTTTIRSKNFSGNPDNGTGGNVFVQVSLGCIQPDSIIIVRIHYSE